ncbi:MAG: hypothetical protein L6437_09215 [Kiritimatiellae bacterium]|nr:hypothetical protein [Kiritimatiellia bacterium]
MESSQRRTRPGQGKGLVIAIASTETLVALAGRRLAGTDKVVRPIELEKERTEIDGQLESIEFDTDRVKRETLSAEVMATTFKTFSQIISSGTPQELKDIVPRIVEVVEWHEDSSNPGSGQCRIGYFEQPRLGIGLKTPEGKGGAICSVNSNNWRVCRATNALEKVECCKLCDFFS